MYGYTDATHYLSHLMPLHVVYRCHGHLSAFLSISSSQLSNATTSTDIPMPHVISAIWCHDKYVYTDATGHRHFIGQHFSAFHRLSYLTLLPTDATLTLPLSSGGSDFCVCVHDSAIVIIEGIAIVTLRNYNYKNFFRFILGWHPDFTVVQRGRTFARQTRCNNQNTKI